MKMTAETLITGATGKTGRRVAERLEAAGWPVRRGSRNGTPRFDWDDEASWPEALAGVRQVYIAYAPDLAVEGATETVARFVERAVAAGVDKLVLLSGRSEAGAVRGEVIVKTSGVKWTVVRASWFDQNFSEGAFLESVRAGTVAAPMGSVPEPFIDVDDIADVAAAALMDDRHAGQLYEVTGPRLLTMAEAVDAIACAAGRDVAYVQIPAEAFRQGLVEARLPPQMVDLMLELTTTLFDGRNAHVTGDVERALGRPARDFSDFARRVAATGVWSAS